MTRATESSFKEEKKGLIVWTSKTSIELSTVSFRRGRNLTYTITTYPAATCSRRGNGTRGMLTKGWSVRCNKGFQVDGRICPG